jgi:signal transduction histidine kinase
LDDLGGLRDLRRLRLFGVAAPVIFLVVHEGFRFTILDTVFEPPTSHLIAVAVGIVAALAFGVLIFFLIERAQRQVVRQNRDLAIVNGVSIATQGELDVDAVLHDAMQRIIDSTGALQATVALHPLDPESGPSREVVLAPPERAGDALAGPERTVEVPLAASGATIGRLHLRIPEARCADLPSPEALNMMGHQLASTLQIGQLVADLQSRRRDGHTFYQALLQTSNQAPLAETLATVVEGARERLAADEGRVCLTRAVLDTLEINPETDRELVDGVACEAPADATAPGASEAADPGTRRHHCPIGASDSYAATLRVPLWAPGELLGDLWVARRAGAQFTERDHRYLGTLAGIAAIAIAGARLREQERQGAILAERDRIARELHDSMAQVLGSTHLRLRRLLAGTELAERPGVSAELEELADVAEEAYRDVREAILGLRESSRPRGFLEALQAYVDKYATQSGIRVFLETSTAGNASIAVSSEIQVLRVIQEALTNVRKHARATTAHVRVTDAQPDGLMIVIEDDGRGFDPSALRVHRYGGYGLQTMRERMELAGGSLRVDSSPNHGTRVIAIVPASPTGRSAALLADRR